MQFRDQGSPGKYSFAIEKIFSFEKESLRTAIGKLPRVIPTKSGVNA
jgi:hypothetical protein